MIRNDQSWANRLTAGQLTSQYATKTFNIAIFQDTINATNVKLCMMVLLNERICPYHY